MSTAALSASIWSVTYGRTMMKQARRASAILGMTTTVLTARELKSICWCDSNNANGSDNQNWLVKDSNGGIDWNQTLHQYATVAGGQIQGAVETGIPTQVSYGFVMGYCSGLALKKVGKAVAVVVGLGFCALQTLSYYGYVQIDQSRLQKDVENLMDLNKDGKVDGKDASVVLGDAQKVLEHGLPSGSGFALGFMGGLRSG